MFLKTALLVLRKDFAIEIKSYEIFATTLFFAVGCVLVFAFALVKEGQAPPDSAAAILWIALLFAGTLALGRTFERERYGETIRALLLAPAPRPAIYVGKLLGILCLLGLTEVLLVPLIALLFAAPLLSRLTLLLPHLVCGTIGFAAVGTLFAAMLMRARTRDDVAGLLYPMTIPVIIAGVIIGALASPPDEPAAIMWLAILLCFDVVFVTLWTFEPLTE
jgi:heme exporter protein CcmB